MKRQSGAALVISLVLLAVITVIGITGMQSSSIEWKMTANSKARADAFEAAEAALRIVEQGLEAKPPGMADFFAGCGGIENQADPYCFNPNCEGGYCFKGEFVGGRCFLEKDTDSSVEFWRLDTIWNDSDKYKFVEHESPNTETLQDSMTVRYIVEFMCFTPGRDGLPEYTGTDQYSVSGYAPLYRITARVATQSGRGEVMLQSTYRVALQ